MKNFRWLLIGLLVFLVSIPLIEQFELLSPRISRALTISWLLVFGVWSLKGFGRLFTVSLVLAGLGIVLQGLATGLGNDALLYPAFTLLLAFLLIAVWCVSKNVILSHEVSENRLLGTVCVYLLFGVAWAVIYTLVEMLVPGSFNGVSFTADQRWNSDWLYFSFVTMSTLGYGDISPLTPLARMLAYLQAVFGIFYIAILVAGLVGAFISERQRDESR